MSAFSFDIQNDAMTDPISMNSKSLNVSYLSDQTWALNDYRDISFDSAYASSNSTFSCGSLTPLSSVSASTSRRQSLVCSAMNSIPNRDSICQVNGFRRPRTPVNLIDQYSNMQEMTAGVYNCTTPSTTSSSQELESMFMMNTEESTFTDKLQAALSLDSCDSAQTSSFLGYGEVDTRCHGLGQDAKSIGSSYSTDQFSPSLGDGEDLTYQGLRTESTYSHSHNNLSSPQTITPSQTYQVPQPAFSATHIPPRILGDPFISPTKKPSGSPYINELQRAFDSPEDSKLYERAAQFREDFSLEDLELCQSFTAKSEFSDDEHTVLSKSASESPNSDAPSLFPRCRQYRKSQNGSRSADSSPRRMSKNKKEGISKVTRHPCPICIQQPGEQKRQFNRPEHLSRHIASVHGTKKDLIRCKVEDCETEIVNRTDNMNAHYRNCHMYGPHKVKGKKRTWLSIEKARELGLGHMDPRTNPTSSKSRSKAVD